MKVSNLSADYYVLQKWECCNNPYCIYQPKHEYVPTAHTIMTDIPLPWTQGLGHASQTCHYQPWQQVWVKMIGIDGCSTIGVARKVSK
jgi:hypothetical protein